MAKLKVAKLQTNYEIVEEPAGPTIRTWSVRVGWASLITLLLIPTMVLAFVSFAFMMATQSMIAVMSFLLFGGVTVVLSRLLRRRRTETLTIAREGLISGGQVFPYKSISEIGTANPVDGKIWREGTTSGALAELQANHGNYLFITYGTQRVPLLRGLTDVEVGQVHGHLVALLEERGYWRAGS